MQRWNCRKICYQLLNVGSGIFGLQQAGCSRSARYHTLVLKRCSRSAVAPDAAWQHVASAFLQLENTLPFPCVTISLVWMHACHVKTAYGLAITSCQMVFWCLVAPWLGWPVLSASSGPVGTFTAQLHGLRPVLKVQRCSIMTEHKRGRRRGSSFQETQEAGNVQCCLLHGGMSTCSSLVPLPTGPQLPRARAGSVAEERALCYTLIYSPARGQPQSVPAPSSGALPLWRTFS